MDKLKQNKKKKRNNDIRYENKRVKMNQNKYI